MMWMLITHFPPTSLEMDALDIFDKATRNAHEATPYWKQESEASHALESLSHDG
jgi:hypothetical protein